MRGGDAREDAVRRVVDFVALPLFDGELGVMPGRAPLIGRLGFGELRTKVALRGPPLFRRRRLRAGPQQRRHGLDQPRRSPPRRSTSPPPPATSKTSTKRRVVTDVEFAEHQQSRRPGPRDDPRGGA